MSYTKCSSKLCLVFCGPLAPFEGRVAYTADELKQIDAIKKKKLYSQCYESRDSIFHIICSAKREELKSAVLLP